MITTRPYHPSRAPISAYNFVRLAPKGPLTDLARSEIVRAFPLIVEPALAQLTEAVATAVGLQICLEETPISATREHRWNGYVVRQIVERPGPVEAIQRASSMSAHEALGCAARVRAFADVLVSVVATKGPVRDVNSHFVSKPGRAFRLLERQIVEAADRPAHFRNTSDRPTLGVLDTLTWSPS